MPFPDNTTLIEDFNRAGGAGLGNNWTAFFGSGIVNDSTETLATGQGASDSSDASYYHQATYGPSAHFYATSRVGGAGSWQAIHFVTTPGSGTTDGYVIYVSYNGTDRIRGYRIDNDVLTQIASQVSYTPADGDLIGLDRNAVTGGLEAYVNTGGGWTGLGGSWSDSTYASGTFWRVGLECSYAWDSTGNAWDDLHGGTVTPSSGARPPLSRWHRQAVVRAAHY